MGFGNPQITQRALKGARLKNIKVGRYSQLFHVPCVDAGHGHVWRPWLIEFSGVAMICFSLYRWTIHIFSMYQSAVLHWVVWRFIAGLFSRCIGQRCCTELFHALSLDYFLDVSVSGVALSSFTFYRWTINFLDVSVIRAEDWFKPLLKAIVHSVW